MARRNSIWVWLACAALTCASAFAQFGEPGSGLEIVVRGELGGHKVESRPVREWTDQTGKYKVEATFVSATDKSIKLRKKDDTIIEVPLARLSAKDRKWVLTAVLKENLGADIRQAVMSVSNGDTTAKRQLIHDQEAARLEKEYGGKECFFTFRITDIQDDRYRAKYRASVEALEMGADRAMRYIMLPLSREDVARIAADDRLILRGKLAVWGGRLRAPSGVLELFGFDSSDNHAFHVGVVAVQYEIGK